MTLELKPPYPPMEAISVDEIPSGDKWQYEPKWDGFRCLAFRDGDRVELQSKSGQPLGRYFPEIVAAVRKLPSKQFVLDGELVVPIGDKLSFDELLMRIHPAESRVKKLSAEHPALYIVFDILTDNRGKSLAGLPLAERRERLEKFAKKHFKPGGSFRLSPASDSLKGAQKWFRAAGGSLDGIVAKRTDLSYQSGNRLGMQKIKPKRTADCVVGGFRYASKRKVVGSLLLGLYDDQNLLHHVGFAANIPAGEREKLTKKLEALVHPPGFTGSAPGGPSRWSNKRSTEWQPLRPKLVAEVEYDHTSDGRFRHGTKFLRWRPDKAPRQCTFEQVAQRGAASLRLLQA